MASKYDSVMFDRCLDDDLQLIRNENVWKIYKHGQSNANDICYVYKQENDPIWWIKLVALVENSTIENIDDLLDVHLKERHSQWHELYLDGRILSKNDDGRSEICYFQ